MNELSLGSLLLRGIKTWQGGDYKTTIDFILVSEDLATLIVKYAVYGTEYRSDYRAIKTVFNILVLVLR